MRKTLLALAAGLIFCSTAIGQVIPPHADGLQEELLELNIDAGVQRAVLSRRGEASTATRLIVLLPGYPSVVRPEMGQGVMMNSPLLGNFLIRARRHLLTEQTLTLLVDCHSSQGDGCRAEYQASPERYRHVMAVVNAARAKAPSIQQVYLLSTSMGSISSGFLPRHGPGQFAGAIHTAAIDPTAPHSYPQLARLNYGELKLPQAFIHHVEDPCSVTSYGYIRSVAERHQIPLISVRGGGDFRGQPCQAFTQHGFRNKEVAVMKHVLKLVLGGAWVSEDL